MNEHRFKFWRENFFSPRKSSLVSVSKSNPEHGNEDQNESGRFRQLTRADRFRPGFRELVNFWFVAIVSVGIGVGDVVVLLKQLLLEDVAVVDVDVVVERLKNVGDAAQMDGLQVVDVAAAFAARQLGDLGFTSRQH